LALRQRPRRWLITDPDELLHFIGRALAHTGANGYLPQLSFAEVLAEWTGASTHPSDGS
jgi:hypothetical protein